MLRLIYLRKQLDINQSSLARRSNLHLPTLNAIEKGHSKAWPGQLASIASALGWPLERAAELMDEVDEHGN